MILSDIEQREYNKYLEEFDFTEDIRNKTFLITNSKGIVGSGIIKWLLEENKKHNTNAHIIASTRNTKNILEEYDDGDSIEWCEFGKEQEFCSDREINYIVHATAPTSNKVLQSQPVELNIPASRNRDSGTLETDIPDTETSFDWLDYRT